MNNNKDHEQGQTLEEYHKDLEELDIIRGAPHDLYFYTKPDRTIGISFNGGLMPNKEMMTAYRQLLDWLLSYDDKVIDLFNESVREDWKRKSQESVRRGNIKQKPKPIRGVVYLLKSDGYFKIGGTKNLSNRFGKTAQATDNPHPIKIIHVTNEVDDCGKAEEKLHKLVKDLKVKGEWYNLPQEKVDMIIRLMDKM